MRGGAIALCVFVASSPVVADVEIQYLSLSWARDVVQADRAFDFADNVVVGPVDLNPSSPPTYGHTLFGWNLETGELHGVATTPALDPAMDGSTVVCGVCPGGCQRNLCDGPGHGAGDEHRAIVGIP